MLQQPVPYKRHRSPGSPELGGEPSRTALALKLPSRSFHHHITPVIIDMLHAGSLLPRYRYLSIFSASSCIVLAHLYHKLVLFLFKEDDLLRNVIVTANDVVRKLIL